MIMNNSVAGLLFIIVGVALFLGFQGIVGLLFLGFFVLLAVLLLWLDKKGAKNKAVKETPH